MWTIQILLVLLVCWTAAGFLFSTKFHLYLNELQRNAQYANKWDHMRAPYSGFSWTTNEYGLNPTLLEYDFIIVGSGPAGCVLANRLSENPNWKILMLEAGEAETIMHRIPALAAYFQSTKSNWGYTAEKNENFCWGMRKQRCGMPRGKALGGSSVINYMIYNRGNPRDFDNWAAAGNTGWSYNEVLPYFIRSEHANLRGKERSPFHGRNGRLSVEDVPYRTPLVHAFVKASTEVGHNQTDYNSNVQVGVSYVQSTTLNGHRHSAATAFLDPLILNRPNLHVLTGARVTKLLIEAESKRVYGVEYVKNRRTFKVNARNEVILSAGTFNSPQLLMLSGIGPAKDLNRIGVPVVQDLPGVGQNMYDHMSHFGPTFIVNSTRSTLRTDFIGLMEFKQYIVGQGPLTTIGGVEALNFVKTNNSKSPADYPDVELIFVPGSLASDSGTALRNGMRIKDSVYNTVYQPLENHNIEHWSVMIMLFHPKSKGYLELKDKNPWHWPRFYPNYFEHEEDVETLLQGIKETIRIAKSPTMRGLGARIHDIPLPNCRHLPFGSDDYWRCSIRTMSCTLHHQVGTCKMGPATDPMAVVDPQLRVHGIKRLRIADTGIIPEPPTAHTNAASFMIGEKAADMIKETWSNAYPSQ